MDYPRRNFEQLLFWFPKIGLAPLGPIVLFPEPTLDVMDNFFLLRRGGLAYRAKTVFFPPLEGAARPVAVPPPSPGRHPRLAGTPLSHAGESFLRLDLGAPLLENTFLPGLLVSPQLPPPCDLPNDSSILLPGTSALVLPQLSPRTASRAVVRPFLHLLPPPTPCSLNNCVFLLGPKISLTYLRVAGPRTLWSWSKFIKPRSPTASGIPPRSTECTFLQIRRPPSSPHVSLFVLYPLRSLLLGGIDTLTPRCPFARTGPSGNFFPHPVAPASPCSSLSPPPPPLHFVLDTPTFPPSRTPRRDRENGSSLHLKIFSFPPLFSAALSPPLFPEVRSCRLKPPCWLLDLFPFFSCSLFPMRSVLRLFFSSWVPFGCSYFRIAFSGQKLFPANVFFFLTNPLLSWFAFCFFLVQAS